MGAFVACRGSRAISEPRRAGRPPQGRARLRHHRRQRRSALPAACPPPSRPSRGCRCRRCCSALLAELFRRNDRGRRRAEGADPAVADDDPHCVIARTYFRCLHRGRHPNITAIANIAIAPGAVEFGVAPAADRAARRSERRAAPSPAALLIAIIFAGLYSGVSPSTRPRRWLL